MTADLSGLRAEFYALMDLSAPDLVTRRSGWERYTPLAGREDIVLVFSLSQGKSSVYLKAKTPAARRDLLDASTQLQKRLLTTPGTGSGQADKGYLFRKDNSRADFTQRSKWSDILEWFKRQHTAYEDAIRTMGDTQ